MVVVDVWLYKGLGGSSTKYWLIHPVMGIFTGTVHATEQAYMAANEVVITNQMMFTTLDSSGMDSRRLHSHSDLTSALRNYEQDTSPFAIANDAIMDAQSLYGLEHEAVIGEIRLGHYDNVMNRNKTDYYDGQTESDDLEPKEEEPETEHIQEYLKHL